MFKILRTTNPKTEKIDKALVEKYISGEMTLKEVKDFSNLFTNRISYILHYIEKRFNDQILMTIFNYGEAIPVKYRKDTEDNFMVSQVLYYEEIQEYIPITVDVIPRFSHLFYDNPFYKKIPTKWLYEDFYDEVEQLYQINLNEEKVFYSKIEEHKKTVKRLQEDIKSKLTEDELKVISLKMYMEIPLNDL